MGVSVVFKLRSCWQSLVRHLPQLLSLLNPSSHDPYLHIRIYQLDLDEKRVLGNTLDTGGFKMSRIFATAVTISSVLGMLCGNHG